MDSDKRLSSVVSDNERSLIDFHLFGFGAGGTKVINEVTN